MGRTAESNFLIGEDIVEGGKRVGQCCGVEVGECAVGKGGFSLVVLG